jgi:hypothetical protein
MFGLSWPQLLKLLAKASGSTGPSPVEQWKELRPDVVPMLKRALPLLAGSKIGRIVSEFIAFDEDLFGEIGWPPPKHAAEPPITIKEAARRIHTGDMSPVEKGIFDQRMGP